MFSCNPSLVGSIFGAGVSLAGEPRPEGSAPTRKELFEMASWPLPPLTSGDRAPGFSLAAANRDRRISLDDYQGRSPLLLGLFRALY